MRKSFKSFLVVMTFAISGIATASQCSAQQSDPSAGFGVTEMAASQDDFLTGNNSLPFENDQSFDVADISVVDPAMASTQSGTDCEACQTCEGTVVVDEQLFPEVRNVNFFGVDREACCDEWSGFCKMKNLTFGCNCGGIKANKGHLGLSWLRSRYGGEDCDYCNGGCCEQNNCNDCSQRKGRFGKGLLKSKSNKSCGCGGKSIPSTVFGRPVVSSCQKCGCCDEACPPEEGCESCK